MAAGRWTRAQDTTPPKKRRIVIAYDTAQPENAVLESLLELIPYGGLTTTCLEILRAGAPRIIEQRGSPIAPPAARTPPPAPTFSAAATAMFEQE